MAPLQQSIQLGLLLGPEVTAPAGADGVLVRGITNDSRKVAPGVVFAAIPGTKVDGASFVPGAVAAGAAAVLALTGAALPPVGVPVLRSDDPRRALALMAARYFGRQPATAVAVTGTSGKTSVAEFTRQIFAALGHPAASLGTIGVVKPTGAIYGSLTTPDPVTLAETLAGLADEGITHLAFEASSHGLDQRRLDGVRLTAAAFTNLGRDHMDYHPTVEHYLAAKMRLFDTLLDRGRTAVVNADGDRAADVVAVARQRGLAVIETGMKATCGLVVEQIEAEGFAQVLSIRHAAGRTRVRLPLIGGYQVENALVAAGLALAAGAGPIDRILAAIETLQGVPGRLDRVAEFRGGLALVDYAHKPEALVAALAACRPFATGKLICVVGCGGDRDRGKRPIMGAIAAQKADVVIVTDDNPRSEVPAAIRAEILAGVPAGASHVREVGDRAQAIRYAVRMMGAGDVVLVAGKGHETGQLVGSTLIPFSDHEEIRRAIEEAGA